MEKIWLNRYPKGVPAEINAGAYRSIVDLFEDSVRRFGDAPSFHNMGKDITFRELDKATRDFAAYLQNECGLKKGDRIAVQMPNLLQFPVAVFGALRAGLVVVNTNPLYTAREMRHQFKDSGVKAVVILANFASHLEQIIDDTEIEHVIVTEIGDLLGFPKRLIVNTVVKHIKRMVPAYDLPAAVSFNEALSAGAELTFQKPVTESGDLAFLQYTGGTTGVSKGAMLTHRNIIANMEMIRVWIKPLLKEGEEVVISPLPMYHIFSLTVNCLAFMCYGGHNVLITNPKDIPGFIKELRKWKFTAMSGVNTLFNALMNHPDFSKIDFSTLKVSVAGATALQTAVARRWMDLTKSVIVEGYGMTEASPVISCNPVQGENKIGTIGLPLPSTEVRLLDDDGREVSQGQPGEITVRGPQVMKGYWNRPDETANQLTPDGWLRTGDVGVFDTDGYLKIVDRKKDMILVSGFNVYPNEIEDVLAQHPGVLEAAAIGIPDEKSGEAVKVFVVRKDPDVDAETLKAFCREQLVAYKVPKQVEFRDELPKSPVGKILRRALKDKSQQPAVTA